MCVDKLKNSKLWLRIKSGAEKGGDVLLDILDEYGKIAFRAAIIALVTEGAHRLDLFGGKQSNSADDCEQI